MTTAREFFEGLEGRLDPSKTAGMTNSYVFEIDGARGESTSTTGRSRWPRMAATATPDATIASEDTFQQIVRGFERHHRQHDREAQGPRGHGRGDEALAPLLSRAA